MKIEWMFCSLSNEKLKVDVKVIIISCLSKSYQWLVEFCKNIILKMLPEQDRIALGQGVSWKVIEDQV